MGHMQALLLLPVLLLAISAHEYAHGITAYYYGDPTAMLAGRCTLAPWKHLDLWGGVILPLVTFSIAGFPLGWAKTLPVSIECLPTHRHMALVCAAGPAANLAMALLLVLLYAAAPNDYTMWAVKINLAFAVFNLLPWPGSDGYQIIKALRA